MANIDERVVAMSFENGVFEARVATTMATLGKLDIAIKNVGGVSGFENVEKSANKVTLSGPMAALDKLRTKLSGAGAGAAEGFAEIDRAGNKVALEGPARAVDKLQAKMGQLSAGSTFTDIEKASSRVTLEGLTRALDNVTNKFSVLQGAASVALGGIASQAAMKGAAFGKSFAFGPIQQGLQEYQTNLNSIQTILANTQGQQVSGLGEVNKHLQELNTYSDQTIYNFSEMAKNIGTFTAAGVDLDTSTASIKGIANLAALSGSNSQQASTAMYQLSQAIAAGRVGLQDWNSVVNAGMGGAVFQKALMRTAENMGTVAKGAVKIDKATGKATVNGESFRNSIMAKPGQESWLTSDVLTKTLTQFTGDLSDAELAAQGFTAEQIKAIQAQAKTAQAAATEVKTLPQVFDVARETIGSGWSQTFQTIFGDFGESKKTFTELSNTINGFINTNAQARNKVLAEWKKLGGRTDLIEGIKNVFKDLQAVLKPIHEAFREIFPATTGKQLADMTAKFREFTERLKVDPATAENIKRTFAGIFAVFDIARKIVGGVIGVILNLLGVVGKGAGGFLAFTGGIGDFLVAIDQAISKGEGFSNFFKGITEILKLPLRLLSLLAHAIAGLFGGDTEGKAKGFEDSLDSIKNKLGPLEGVIDKVTGAWHKMVDILGRVKEAIDPWLGVIGEKLSGVGDVIKNAFDHLNYDVLFQGLQAGFVGGIFLVLKKAFGKGLPSLFGDSLEGVNGILKGLTENLTAMQSKVKAQAILAIAGAVAVLAGGILILSTINGEDLQRSMTAVAIGLGELMGAMKLMTAGVGGLGVLALPVIAAGLVGVALAVTILAGALKIFATMSWEEIGKGLAAVAGSLTAVGLAMRLMGGPEMVLQAAGLVLIGLALTAIGGAMKVMASMKLEEAAKGVFAIVEALAGIALGVSLMPPTLPLTAAGLILIGIALGGIAAAVKAFGAMDFGTIVKGLGAVIAAVAGIGIAMQLMPANLPLTAVGLVLVSGALAGIAAAIATLGNLSVGTLVKGIAGIAGVLLVLAAGLTAMIASLPGALALTVVAAGLVALVPVLGILGTMKWSTIFKGLGAIAAVLVTIGVAGLVAAPALTALGIALLPLGVSFLLVATGASMFANAIAKMSESGQKGFTVFLAALIAFAAQVPGIILSFIKGIVGIADSVAQLAPKVVTALGVIIDTVIAFVIEAAPKLAVAIGTLVDAILQVVLAAAPKLIQAGYTLLLDLMAGLRNNIGQIVNVVVQIIVNLVNGLARNAQKLASAGVNMVIAFVNGVASQFPKIVAVAGSVIVRFISAFVGQVPKITAAAVELIGRFIGELGNHIGGIVNAGANLIIKFLSGIENAIPKIKTKALSVARAFLNNLADGIVGLADIVFRAFINLLNGLAETIRNNDDALINAGANLGSAIGEGMIKGFSKMGGLVRSALTKVFDLLPGWAKKILGIHSPSAVFAEIGQFTMQGFAKGVQDSAPEVQKSGEKAFGDKPGGFIHAIRGLFGIHSPSEIMRDIGMNVSRGFAQGLSGSSDDVKNAFSSLNDQLIDKIRDLRSQVEDGNAQLEDLQTQHAQKLADIAKLRSKGEDTTDAVKEANDLQKQIDAQTASLNINTTALKNSRTARDELNKGMDDEKRRLLGLKKDYDDITKQLETASGILQQAITDRENAKKSLVDKFDTTPTVDDDSKTKVQDYIKALTAQIAATKSYTDTLAKLRAMGLDDQTYQKLLDEGLAGKDFAEQLLKGGQTAVDSVNALDAQLLAAATKLSDDMSAQLYDAGINAAKALVDGLKSQQAALETQMNTLAEAMVKAIKRALKIKSPSQVFVELGKLTLDGLSEGFDKGGEGAKKSLQLTAQDLVKTARDTLGRVPDMLGNMMDLDPTITPVLDLSNVKRDAQQLGDLTNVVPITAAASFGQASAISTARQSVDNTGPLDRAIPPSFKFEQNNYSPESLSEIEIYRNTKNQFAQLKSLVGAQ